MELVEHELNYLTLEHHVDCHAGGLGLGAEQRGAKYNSDTLNRHPVGLFMLDHPEEREREIPVRLSVSGDLVQIRRTQVHE